MVRKRVPDGGDKVAILCILAFTQTVTSLQLAGGLPLTYDLNLIQPPVTPVYTYNTVSGLNSVFAVPPPAPPPQLVPVTTQAHLQNDDLQLAEYIYQQLNEFTDSFKADPGSIKMSASLANPSAPGMESVRLHETNGLANSINQNIKVIQHGESGISAHYVSRPQSKPSSTYLNYQHGGSQHPGHPVPRQQNDPKWNHHTAVVIANANSNVAPSSSSDMYERNQASIRLQPRPNSQAAHAHTHDRGGHSGSNPQQGLKNYEIVQSPLSAQESKRIEDELNAGRPAYFGQTRSQGQNDAGSNYKSHDDHAHTILPPIRYDDHTHSVEYYPLGTSSGNDRVTLGGSSASNPSVYYRTANRVTYPSVILKNSENVAIHYPSLQVGGNQEPSFEHNAYAAAMMTGVQWQNQQYKPQEAKQASRPSSEKALQKPTSEHQKFGPNADLNQAPSKFEQSYKRKPLAASNAFKINNGGVKDYRNEPERNKQSQSYEKTMSGSNTATNGEMMKSIGYEVSESKLPYRYSNGDGKRQVKDNNVGIWQPMNRTQTLHPSRINDTIVGVRKPGERPRPPKMLRGRGKDSHLLMSESQTRPRSVKYSVSMVTRSKSKSRFPPARQMRPTAVQLTESKKRKRDGFRQNLARYVKKFRAVHARNVQRQNLSMKKLRRIWNQLSGSSSWEAKRY